MLIYTEIELVSVDERSRKTKKNEREKGYGSIWEKPTLRFLGGRDSSKELQRQEGK